MNEQKLDIVYLIEKSPKTRLSDNYNSTLLTKIKNEFTESQQQLFASNFYCYLSYNSKKDFIISLDKVWKWVGFGRKSDAKRVLEKHLNINIDYKVVAAEVAVKKNPEDINEDIENKIETRGRKKEEVLMTINTFKKFCLKANTKKVSCNNSSNFI